uniref:SWIM-type domain-containing protein n=1 Tax=Cannabis sativa TaxID=3483 RepID=A0A803PXQ5_CANSA
MVIVVVVAFFNFHYEVKTMVKIEEKMTILRITERNDDNLFTVELYYGGMKMVNMQEESIQESQEIEDDAPFTQPNTQQVERVVEPLQQVAPDYEAPIEVSEVVRRQQDDFEMREAEYAGEPEIERENAREPETYNWWSARLLQATIGNKPWERLIGLDGCHLKGYCKGILLAAIGIDGANSIFPIAYAVVGKETTESWTWFLELLKEDLHPTNPCIYTMMSDRQKGLQNAVDKIFIGSDGRFCVRHMHGNFKKDFPGLLLKQMLWAAARATTLADFERKMKDLKDVNEGAYNWLAGKNLSEWSKSHFKESVKCDMLLNNICESFNSAILNARDKPIVTLLESLRLWLMRKFTKNRENVGKWKNPVHNNIMKILDKQMEISAYCSVERANATMFQVTMNDGKRLIVDLDTHTCTCRRWQLTGLPCGHGLATIFFAKHEVWGYIHSWYHKATYKAAYLRYSGPKCQARINLPNKGSNPILPPHENNLLRPKKKRNLSANEPPPANAIKLSKKGQLNHCGNCGQVGHSRRTCKNEAEHTLWLSIPQPKWELLSIGPKKSLDLVPKRTCPTITRKDLFDPAIISEMKRKKWSELEEQTLLTKYAELLNTGALAKLKTREKKFKPIADHVNTLHHLTDPITFPFKWSWRDVSIKVQNMRHQYLGVKQKIRLSDEDFNWKDGENHWENFLKYKEVFGDVELEPKGKKSCESIDKRKMKKGVGVARKLGLVGARVLELRDVMLKREERRREREYKREKGDLERDAKRKQNEFRKEKRRIEREEWLDDRELDLEERQMMWARRESERRMVGLQIEHEKQMMQMHAEACQNQMQILGLMARLLCQFFGSPNDGLGGALGTLPLQLLQNLQHPGGLGDSGKPDANSPSEFI